MNTLNKLVSLSTITTKLDSFFEIYKLEKDPAMSHFIPNVYKNVFGWKSFFDTEFLERYNGLMIKGDDKVGKIFTASFPNEEILKNFINKSSQGDLLFLHHPIQLECGDPKGKLGKGFLPINKTLLKKITQKKLSIYSCHAPLDYNKKISTNISIAKKLKATILEEFLPYGNGYAGLYASIDPISTDSLIIKLKKIFNIPYVDFAGKKVDKISKISIIAGGGDEVEYTQKYIKYNIQAYITGEIFSHYTSDWGKENTKKIKNYAKTVDFSMVGVSHSASEFLVMRTQMADWFKKNFNLPVIPLPQSKWWV